LEREQLSIGTVISRVVSIYASQATAWIPVSACLIGLPAILLVLGARAGGIVFPITIIVWGVATLVFTGSVVELVAAEHEGRGKPDAAALVRSVIPVLGSLILVSIVAWIAIAIGLFLVIVPGLILLTIWAVFVPIVVLDNPGELKALSASREMVRGNGWQVFGALLVLTVFVAVVQQLVLRLIESGSLATGIVVLVVVSMLLAPFSGLAASVIYFELKRLGGPRGGLEPFEPVALPPAGIHEEPEPGPSDTDY